MTVSVLQLLFYRLHTHFCGCIRDELRFMINKLEKSQISSSPFLQAFIVQKSLEKVNGWMDIVETVTAHIQYFEMKIKSEHLCFTKAKSKYKLNKSLHHCLSLKKRQDDEMNLEEGEKQGGNHSPLNYDETNLIVLKPARRELVTPEMIHLRSATWNNLRFSKLGMKTQIITSEYQNKSLKRPHLFSPSAETRR